MTNQSASESLGPPPVRRVSVISTGFGYGHPEHIYGTRKPALWWILRSKEWVKVPLNVFVIDHVDGLVLFDTGADRAVVTDPGYWPDRVTRFFMNHIFRWEIGPEDTLAHQLELAGYSRADVATAVLSHLHADHAGGIRDIPDAELFVAPEAWHHMLGPNPERKMVLRRDLAVPGFNWRYLAFEPTNDPLLAPFGESFDLRGDGSMVVVPTPGHLPGSVSMLIRATGSAPLFLIGDLSYSEELLMADRFAGTGDKKLLRESFAKVRALKEQLPDLVILAAHDESAADKIVAANRDAVRPVDGVVQ